MASYHSFIISDAKVNIYILTAKFISHKTPVFTPVIAQKGIILDVNQCEAAILQAVWGRERPVHRA